VPSEQPTDPPLIIVSNRGPAQFDRDADGERVISRGGGGLVTALTGLATHRRVLWVASAMTEEDAVVAREAGGPTEIELEGGSYEVELVASESAAYDLFYSVIANPLLWFTQHYLWDLSNAPDIRVDEKAAWREGYRVVNDDIAQAVLKRLEGEERPLVMFHDYHLYTAPAIVRAGRP
jgi:trehalose 6-phosphate synthase